MARSPCFPLLLCRLFLAALLLLAVPALAVPALWTASKAGRTVILYGTIHALPPGTDWFSPKARAAFARADTLVVEMLPPTEPGATAELTEQIAYLPTPVPIRDRLPDDLKGRYDAMVKASDLPLANLDRMKSWFAALSLVQLEMLMNGIDPAAGVDVTLIGRARAAGKQLVGLETPPGQLELFNGLPEAEQRLLLASAVADAGQSQNAMRALVTAWSAGDIARIRRDFDDASLSPELERRLLTDRNAAWARFVAARRKGRLFMAVGAAHMAGPGSLIEMLKARGFRVRRVE
ncbi:TraB/GumN family protein [Sandarakinorhabdus rubra]|uniref:TraB/GumN family protein n=1 Tax=Sandarakinorhabdus rubra TaxID=2672568 RepID=UPI0013DA73B3|nr:TraB/GumN family protein [Sandarakinorhabdus rubra]